MKNKKFLRLEKKLFLLPRIFVYNLRNFIIKFYIKISLVIIIIFLFYLNIKKLKKTEQKKIIT